MWINVVAEDCIHDGDANQDGVITSADAQATFFIVLGIITPSPDEACAADCNGDDSVTAADAQTIFMMVLGLDACEDSLFERHRSIHSIRSNTVREFPIQRD
ncbi:dockerin type I repeat-containing protein [bacterium]|nr:dockerin type I repeat-containing protein [candidate division CSSED10-310 bacterium]